MPRSRAAQNCHNKLRRLSRSKARKAIFIADYIAVKYANIYKEVEAVFNKLDEKYKDKNDLRKTDEFLFFKLTMEGKLASESLPTETAMDSESLSTETTCESLPAETACESLSTETTCESLPAETACESLSTETACESLPAEMACESLPAETACESLPAETACESLPAETACESLPAEMACESLPTETATACESLLSLSNLPATKQLQLELKIDLMSDQQVREASVTTQTLSLTTEQEAPPISVGDIPVDMIDQIIEQLRQDPALTEIFKDIDLQMEFEQLGEDLDIPPNLLEEELLW